MPNENAHNFVDILGHQLWPDLTFQPKLWNGVLSLKPFDSHSIQTWSAAEEEDLQQAATQQIVLLAMQNTLWM